MGTGDDMSNIMAACTWQHRTYHGLKMSVVKYPRRIQTRNDTQLRLDKELLHSTPFTLTEACHRQGALIGIQINHAGASAMSSKSVYNRYLRHVFRQKAGVERDSAAFRKRRSQALQKIMELTLCKESSQCRI